MYGSDPRNMKDLINRMLGRERTIVSFTLDIVSVSRGRNIITGKPTHTVSLRLTSHFADGDSREEEMQYLCPGDSLHVGGKNDNHGTVLR